MWNDALTPWGGGIGTRGPGEKKLEVDRRRIKQRISILKKELEKVRSKRKLLRSKRKSNQMKVAALIGYTNSGKSTLLNTLTGADVLSEDKLFATLDPVTRRLYLPNKSTVLLTDTVGFIQKLPHQLVNAFRATLEETIEADLLLHVIDSSSKYAGRQIEAVYQTLEELKIIDTPILNVFNKVDLTAGDPRLLQQFTPSVTISALNGNGLDRLKEKILELILNDQLPPQ
ncbi:GTPase HflX [Candidatus Margulisiibacteriota bacterium]